MIEKDTSRLYIYMYTYTHIYVCMYVYRTGKVSRNRLYAKNSDHVLIFRFNVACGAKRDLIGYKTGSYIVRGTRK